MINRDSAQLECMNKEVEFIIETTAGVSKDEFLKNELLQHAVCMSIITIGECANHLSEEFTEKHTDIQWMQIVGIRNMTAHGYRRLNMEQIWEAIITDVPRLRQFLSQFV
ncbi:MAG: DUF86 domain-containing protein [Chitinispirillia bacterium]|nr:DUF86 domain-containing protein [Chitinispirillia bacterium]MCL2242399.1 DUF86 domain-containing protein [Chitinispirillia bacterium]